MKRLSCLICVLCCMVGTAGAAGSPVVLAMLDYWDAEIHMKGMGQLIGEYEALNPNVKIERTVVPSAQFWEKLLTLAMSKQYPDIAAINNADLPALLDTGSLADITATVKKGTNWNDFYEGYRAACMKGDSIYALFVGTNNLALYYNKDLFAKAGLANPPATWDDLIQYGAKLKKAGVVPLTLYGLPDEFGSWTLQHFLLTGGATPKKMDSPEALKTLRFWKSLVDNGVLPKDVSAYGYGEFTGAFQSGTSAMEVNGPWERGAIPAKINYGIAKLPVPRKGMNPVTSMGGEILTVGKSTVEKEQAAAQFILWLSEEKQMVKFVDLMGYLPTRASVMKVFTDTHPDAKVFLEQAQFAQARAVYGGGKRYAEVSAILGTTSQTILTGKADPKELAAKVAVELAPIFK